MISTPSKRYDLLSQFFHWATALAVLAAYFIEPHIHRLLRQGIDPGTSSNVVWHESLGILVFTLTLLRLLWLTLRPTPPEFELSRHVHLAARIMQGILWLLVLITPLTALLMLAGKNVPLTLLGGLRLQEIPILGQTAIAHMFDWGDVHETLGNALIIVAGVHAAAAIYHQFILKDQVLASMLPGRRS
jgi:cytochrome b561